DEVMKNIAKMQRAPGATMTGPLFSRALETLTTQESLEVENGVSLFTQHYPILNKEKCQGCHGSDHQVRAVVRVATSMEPVFAEVRRHRNRQIMIAALTILAAAAVLTVAMSSVVVRPIVALSAVARRIGDGDFEARAPAQARDEIGELGGAFNDMTSRLARAHTELATKNKELETALQNLQESRQRLALLEQLKGELSKFVPDAVKKLLERSPNATELEKRTAGTGAGQRRTFTATGPTTNVAARFAGSAQGGEIAVGPTTAERIRAHFVLESLGERTFKNVSQPIHVYRMIPPGIYEKIV